MRKNMKWMVIENIQTNMKIDARMVIVVAILLTSVILSSCVTKTEITTSPKEAPSQPISVTEEHTDREFTLFVAITKPLPYSLETVLIQPDGDETTYGSRNYWNSRAGWVGSINITFEGIFDGNNIVMLRNMENKSEILYQANWTVRLPNYKTGENISIKGLDIMFKPYQITSAYDPNKKRIEIPVEGKNTKSIKEKGVKICVQRLKVDRGYFYKAEGSLYTMTKIEFKLEPDEKDDKKITFEIPNNFEPIEMHGYFDDYGFACSGNPSKPEDGFVLELKK